MQYPMTALDILRNSRHENAYTYHRIDSNEFLSLAIVYDEWTPHSFIHTIRDDDGMLHGTWGYVHEMYPNATMSQKINFGTIIKDAWAEWVADMENDSIYRLAIDTPFDNKTAKMYITQVQNKGAL